MQKSEIKEESTDGSPVDVGLAEKFQLSPQHIIFRKSTLWVGIDDGGAVTGLMTRDLSETWGLGRNALTDGAFLRQFLRTGGDAQVGAGVDAISGATVTSRAVATGVNAAVAYVTGADVLSGATQWVG